MTARLLDKFDAAAHTSDALNQIPLFRDFSPEQLAWVGERLRSRIFVPEQFVLLSEQIGEAVYVVVDGAVKVQIDQFGGTDIILAVLGPGDVVGEMGMLNGQVGRSANVMPLVASRLMWLDRHTFQELVKTVPAFSVNLMYILANRLRHANEQVRAVSTLDVAGRVARQLLLLADQFGVKQADDDLSIPLRLTQSDLAALISASRERVNQALSRMKSQELVSVDNDGYFHLHDIEALADLCVGYLPISFDLAMAK